MISIRLQNQFVDINVCVHDAINNNMLDKEIFKDHSDYWLVADNIKNLYMSEGSILSLLDFERVLDELDIYAFKNWILGELVDGPEIGRYSVTCTFMWPEKLMPDPRGGKRLLPFDCKVKYMKKTIKIPVKIEDPEDFIPGTHKARLIEKPVWLVEITMPKALITDIRTGSTELEGESIDLEDLDTAYEEDLDQEEFRADDGEETQQNDQQQQQSEQPGTI
jgi:hypothetical protein